MDECAHPTCHKPVALLLYENGKDVGYCVWHYRAHPASILNLTRTP